MAFRLPDFNLLCNIWFSNVVPPVGVPDVVDSDCQLAWDGTTLWPVSSTAVVKLLMHLRLPPGTQVHAATAQAQSDAVEVPSGSGRYYRVMAVDDVGKGFANEYRQALIVAVQFPDPLP